MTCSDIYIYICQSGRGALPRATLRLIRSFYTPCAEMVRCHSRDEDPCGPKH